LVCLIRAESENIAFFEKFGFKVREIFESKFAEKYFSSRYWFLLGKDF
jgi:ribosomal protein S18 acetylase RimI-like enzyme